MARIAFILLCHKDPQAVIAQARRLTAAGDHMVIHFDGRADDAAYREIAAALSDTPDVVVLKKRVKCGWGEWSLVQATLNAVDAALEAFPKATHLYMVSGDCMPIKSAEYAHALLDSAQVDHIESVDYFRSGWIKTGMREERLIYRHFLNERKHKRLFYAAVDWQKRLGLQRKVPADLEMMIGSQWWCLRRRTVEALRDFCRARPDVMRFFRTTWIPDETFFQTLVRHLVPENEIRSRSLTFLMFTDYGMPVTFYNDHYDLLLGQDYLFARKISPGAEELKQRLGALWAATGAGFEISDEGRRLHQFLTGRGRIGRRFAPRFWETESSIGRDRVLMIVICRKWDLARRLVERIRQVTNLPALGYVFQDAATPLPDLGGLQSTLEKRDRHRRALVRMLFDYYATDRMILCMDPAGFDHLRDFASDRAEVRFLDIECETPDSYLTAHAVRMGLAGETTPPAAMDRLLTTLRHDFAFQTDRIRDAGFDNYHVIRDTDAAERTAGPLAEFLGIPREAALEIAGTDTLFAD
ncbi:MAG: DUF5928 domain-containing protein [Pseudooceanicola nanhaiensis]|uniref:DUF5928 domain-containing protein n=1 Tax=Pseudooceanicola nanhaiensis TaxID=375761 RepID=UPI004057E521